MRISNIIEKPIITEKAMARANKEGKYTFRVGLRASKSAIAAKAKELFGVDVLDVSTSIMPGKKKRVLKTYRFTKTAKWKKAVIQVKENQKIDLFDKAK